MKAKELLFGEKIKLVFSTAAVGAVLQESTAYIPTDLFKAQGAMINNKNFTKMQHMQTFLQHQHPSFFS